jgi:hypothetical protein
MEYGRRIESEGPEGKLLAKGIPDIALWIPTLTSRDLRCDGVK